MKVGCAVLEEFVSEEEEMQAKDKIDEMLEVMEQLQGGYRLGKLEVVEKRNSEHSKITTFTSLPTLLERGEQEQSFKELCEGDMLSP